MVPVPTICTKVRKDAGKRVLGLQCFIMCVECLFGFLNYFLSVSDAISASVQEQALLVNLGERHQNVIVWVEVYMPMIFFTSWWF